MGLQRLPSELLFVSTVTEDLVVSFVLCTRLESNTLFEGEELGDHEAEESGVEVC